MARFPRVLSRRCLLRTAGAGAAITASTGLGIRTTAAQYVPAAGTRIRRNVNDPQQGAAAAAAYREAVAAMRALPPGDARNWITQADIHQQFCPHRNWYFLPWHRAYLVALEAICSELIGEPDFALPYWNWTVDRQLPRDFVDAEIGGAPNALHDATRAMGSNDTLTTRLSPFGVDVEALFGAAAIENRLQSGTFQAFGSFKPQAQNSIDPQQWQQAEGVEAELEAQPHDFGHGAVGGNMGNLDNSPRDPIFYLHHGNLDRLWAHWTARGNANDPDPLWRDFVFVQNFWDRAGQGRLDFVVRDLESTEALGYRYDDVPPPPAAGPRVAAASKLQSLAVAEETLSASLATVTTADLQLPPQSREVVQSSALRQEGRIYAVIRDIETPADREVNVRVFINCPYLTPLTPVDDPHYAGSFTFFVAQEGHHGNQRSVAIDISDTVRRLAGSRRAETEDIKVQLLPIGYAGRREVKADFKVGAVEILAL